MKENKRIYFLDNLRTCMIFLVVLVHSGGVYESSGVWAFFWIVDDPSTTDLAGRLHLIVDIFVMSTIFFISGYLTPISLRSKSGWKFIKTKFRRLIIPWMIAVLTLIPIYKIIFLYSRGLPQENWTTYFHWTNGNWSQNWLWFLPVLFMFDMIYLGISKIKLKLPEIGLKTAVSIVFILGLVFSILMDIMDLEGWTKTILIDFQNERLMIYFLMFLLGAFFCRIKVFGRVHEFNKTFIALFIITVISVYFYRVFYIQSFVFPGVYFYSEIVDTLLRWLSFHVSLLSLLYLIINTFRTFLDRQGKILNLLNRNSYNVYIIHTIVMGCIALIMLNTAIPSLMKYALLTFLTYIVSNMFVTFYHCGIKTKIKYRRK